MLVLIVKSEKLFFKYKGGYSVYIPNPDQPIFKSSKTFSMHNYARPILLTFIERSGEYPSSWLWYTRFKYVVQYVRLMLNPVIGKEFGQCCCTIQTQSV